MAFENGGRWRGAGTMGGRFVSSQWKIEWEIGWVGQIGTMCWKWGCNGSVSNGCARRQACRVISSNRRPLKEGRQQAAAPQGREWRLRRSDVAAWGRRPGAADGGCSAHAAWAGTLATHACVTAHWRTGARQRLT